MTKLSEPTKMLTLPLYEYEDLKQKEEILNELIDNNEVLLKWNSHVGRYYLLNKFPDGDFIKVPKEFLEDVKSSCIKIKSLNFFEAKSRSNRIASVLLSDVHKI